MISAWSAGEFEELRRCGQAAAMPELRLVVAAGSHRRLNCPVGLLLPIPLDLLDLPTLYREGRKRSIPCQLEPTAHGTKLWWMVENLAPNQDQVYTLTTGERQRQATPRVRIESPRPGAFALLNRLEKGLHLETGEPGQIMQCHLTAPSQAHLRLQWRGGERLPVRPSKPRLQEGPVFSSLTIDQDRIDAAGTVWHETLHCRLYGSFDDACLFDCTLTVHASTAPVRLGPDLWPMFEVEPAGGVVIVSPGWRLDDARPQASGPFAWMEGPRSATLLYRSDGFGFPPIWSRTANGVTVQPHLGPSETATIRLGRTASFYFRFLTTADLDGETARDAFFDFDAPPSASVELVQ